MRIDTEDDALAERELRSGRRGLFLNPTDTVRFAGWTASESKPLLEQLQRHATVAGTAPV
jgi:alpha-ketoglutarate-dependent taurine dioxygenase